LPRPLSDAKSGRSKRRPYKKPTERMQCAPQKPFMAHVLTFTHITVRAAFPGIPAELLKGKTMRRKIN